MRRATRIRAIGRMVWSLVLGSVVVLLCAQLQAQAPAQAGAPPASQGGAQAGPIDHASMPLAKYVMPMKKIDGSYDVTFVLERAVMHNIMTLCSGSDGKTLTGSLHSSADSSLITNFTGVFNDSGFLFTAKVGPGTPNVVGFADGKITTGKITIDQMVSDFVGTLSDKKFDCAASK